MSRIKQCRNIAFRLASTLFFTYHRSINCKSLITQNFLLYFKSGPLHLLARGILLCVSPCLLRTSDPSVRPKPPFRSGSRGDLQQGRYEKRWRLARDPERSVRVVGTLSGSLNATVCLTFTNGAYDTFLDDDRDSNPSSCGG